MAELANITGVGVAGLAVLLTYALAAHQIRDNTRAVKEFRDGLHEFLEYLRRHH